MIKKIFIFGLLLLQWLGTASNAVAQAHFYEVEEKSFSAEKIYDNPYMDVDLWIDLSGPDGQQIRIPALGDRGKTFRVRMMGTVPGTWNWSTGKGTQEPFLFNFASFLLFYGPNSSYIFYSGYNKPQGMLEDHSEFDLVSGGKPLGSAVRNGWVYTREFEHLTVTVNLETKEAKIEEHALTPSK